MTTLTTANFGIAYCDDQTQLKEIAGVTAAAAATIDAALTRGGVAPPNAQDLVAVAGRVTSLETSRTTDENRLTALETARPGKKLWRPAGTPTQSVGAAWALITTWESRDSYTAGAGMFASANSGRLTATKAGRYRATVTLPSNIGTSSARQLQLRTQPAGQAGPSAATGAMVGASILQAQTGLAVQQCLGDEFYMGVGDWFECYAFSSVAATPFGTQNGYDAFMTMTFIGATA